MKIFTNKTDLNREIREQKAKNKKIGFVPTMGFLHEGHVTLFKESKKQNDFTVASIFVNPAQFNDPKDFEKYPRDTEGDSKKCEEAGVDFLYIPDVKDIYSTGKAPAINISIPHLMKNLCATARPGHFEGVLLVIANLFHAVEPDRAYFGKKDYQQYLIIREFCKYLSFPVEIIGMETIREKDGLAMSSRNARLSAGQRKNAVVIFESMNLIKDLFQKGERDISKLKKLCENKILEKLEMRVDYIELVNPDTLGEAAPADNRLLLAIAVFCGEVRLIDNMVI